MKRKKEKRGVYGSAEKWRGKEVRLGEEWGRSRGGVQELEE